MQNKTKISDKELAAIKKEMAKGLVMAATVSDEDGNILLTYKKGEGWKEHFN